MKKTKLRSIGTSKGFIIPRDILEFSGIIEDAVVYNLNDKIVIERDKSVGLKHGLIVELANTGVTVEDNIMTLPNGVILELNPDQIVQMNKGFHSNYKTAE